jgi:hypothetical protein
LAKQFNKTRVEKKGEYVREYQQKAKRAANNIYDDIPLLRQHTKEYERGRKDLKFFLEFYFPQAFALAWSPDHLKVIETLERNVLDGGLLAVAMPRGSGKTTIFLGTALWAILYNHRRFVCLISATKNTNDLLMDGLKSTLLNNDKLHASFPAETVPFKLLENNSHKQRHQRYGEDDETAPLTNIGWGTDELVFATIPASNCPSSKISARSIEGAIRGQSHYLPDGTVIRPDLVLVDDPQDRDSAKSPSQTKYRLDILNGDVLYLPGPGVKMSGMLACTVVYENDLAHQLLDRKKNPDWQGQKMQALYSKPTRMDLWDKYWQIRSESLQQDGDGSDATEFYKQNRAAMDEGSKVAWDARHNPDELSALQHIMNLYYRDPETFNAEYQNEPTAKQDEDVILRVDDVLEHLNGRNRFEIPLQCQYLTEFVDLHDNIHYYCICAWAEDFTGYVIDYGTFPDQKRLQFTQSNAPVPISKMFPGLPTETAMQKALEALLKDHAAKKYTTANGGLMQVKRVLVDRGYKPNVVENVRHIIGDVMQAARGRGFTAGQAPISAFPKKQGEQYGHFWYSPNVARSREFRHIVTDVNYWKTFVHQQIALNAITLWGNKGSEHRLFAEHIANSETFVVTQGQGRTVREWKLKPNKPDNHWFDCLVGCAVAASMCGCAIAGQATKSPERKKVRLSDLQKAKKGLR